MKNKPKSSFNFSPVKNKIASKGIKIPTPSNRNFWDTLSLLSTFMSTVILAVIGILLIERTKEKEQIIQEKTINNESIIKKSELIEKFSPLLLSEDSSKNKLAIIGMYVLDSGLALKIATLVESPGTKSAVRILFNNLVEKPIYLL